MGPEAYRVQQWWRMVRARRLLAQLKQERMNQLARSALCIQQLGRRYIARRRVRLAVSCLLSGAVNNTKHGVRIAGC